MTLNLEPQSLQFMGQANDIILYDSQDVYEVYTNFLLLRGNLLLENDFLCYIYDAHWKKNVNI